MIRERLELHFDRCRNNQDSVRGCAARFCLAWVFPDGNRGVQAGLLAPALGFRLEKRAV